MSIKSKIKGAVKAVKKAVTPKAKAKVIDLSYEAREAIFAVKLQQLMAETGVILSLATRDMKTLGVNEVTPTEKAVDSSTKK